MKGKGRGKGKGGAVSNDGPSLGDLLFDDETFAKGMSAANFQMELMKITTMTEREVEALLDTFLAAHRRHIRERRGNDEDDAPPQLRIGWKTCADAESGPPALADDQPALALEDNTVTMLEPLG